MTEKQFWMKADQISESHKSHEEKSVLISTAQHISQCS